MFTCHTSLIKNFILLLVQPYCHFPKLEHEHFLLIAVMRKCRDFSHFSCQLTVSHLLFKEMGWASASCGVTVVYQSYLASTLRRDLMPDTPGTALSTGFFVCVFLRADAEKLNVVYREEDCEGG